MANMGYCRFQNTANDLRDCLDALSEIDSLDELSEAECRSAKRLFRLCREYADAEEDYTAP
jgi:hypothetical protein